MKISSYSRSRILSTFSNWQVPKDFADPMYNYMIFGYSPGSCFTSVLANDFVGAMRSSHPSNTITAFKALAGWIHSHLPPQAYGSYNRVQAWGELDTEERRVILEHNRLIYTAKEETWLALKGESEFV